MDIRVFLLDFAWRGAQKALINKKRAFESFREFLRVFARFTYFYLGKILPNFFRLRLITRDFEKNI